MDKKKPNNARIQFKWFSLEITQRSRDKREKCYLSEGYLYEKFKTSSGIARSCLQHSLKMILDSNFEKKQQKTVFSITELNFVVCFFSRLLQKRMELYMMTKLFVLKIEKSQQTN